MTRRAFLRNLLGAAAVLSVPVEVLGDREPEYLAMMREETRKMGERIAHASQPIYPECGYCIMHRRSSSFRQGDPLFP